MEKIINWSGRGQQYTSEELKLITEVATLADPLTQGQYQKQFEKDFENYLGQNGHAYAVSSATAAIELAAILCQFEKGDEVIIPAHTFVASAISFARLGCVIKWADIDFHTRVIDIENIRKLITPKTKALMAVHLYGNAAPMQELQELCSNHDIILIEDAAQALGGELNHQKLGTFGDFSCFSFHTHKNISTLGEGGMLWVKDPNLAKMVPGLRHNGLRPFENQEYYWKPAMSNVDFDLQGIWPYNFCMAEVPSALGSALLKRNDQIIEKRTQRANKFLESFKNFPELIFQKIQPQSKHAWHLMTAYYDSEIYGKSRDDLISSLFNTYKLKTVVQYYPLYRYPIFQKSNMSEASCPNTDKFFDNMISFPFHEWMSHDDFDEMIKRVQLALIELRK
ncbi:DegT/DnrJ/EryC1/StrS family aminotransferase [Silvanigrella aquatica]|uniref:Pyridoxal phosphate-dependent aminotransferase n=1 Tax=Silvanigrella aquatica TaxID=1915309 RepID=A0A1L4D2Z5_9BACT|nr:DegT/DnrJ/EryC1/StrS family aminotransferase [Silvanigrella aquatica]APJ04570.1 pyridoxal phosphate-dependent aminotransferase [Silvanigrella aquatica]